MMTEANWLIYLKENEPSLYADAIADLRWAKKERDEKIAQLEAQLVGQLARLNPVEDSNSELLNDGVEYETALDLLSRAAKRHEDENVVPVVPIGGSEGGEDD